MSEHGQARYASTRHDSRDEHAPLGSSSTRRREPSLGGGRLRHEAPASPDASTGVDEAEQAATSSAEPTNATARRRRFDLPGLEAGSPEKPRPSLIRRVPFCVPSGLMTSLFYVGWIPVSIATFWQSYGGGTIVRGRFDATRRVALSRADTARSAMGVRPMGVRWGSDRRWRQVRDGGPTDVGAKYAKSLVGLARATPRSGPATQMRDNYSTISTTWHWPRS